MKPETVKYIHSGLILLKIMILLQTYNTKKYVKRNVKRKFYSNRHIKFEFFFGVNIHILDSI